MQNPDIKEISTQLKAYLIVHNKQSTEKDKFYKENKDVLDMLPQVDDLIRDIYDEVEFEYRIKTASNKRKLARELGVIYVSRKGEEPEDGVIDEDEMYNTEII